MQCSEVPCVFLWQIVLCLADAVQIPPSTAYAPPMKRPIEEEEGPDDKSPNKKKKKLQKKCKYIFRLCIVET